MVCLGSQFAPIMTPKELLLLFQGVMEKGWLVIVNSLNPS